MINLVKCQNLGVQVCVMSELLYINSQECGGFAHDYCLFFSFPTVQEETANIVNLYMVDARKWVEEPNSVYIGQESPYYNLAASKWGNPFRMRTGFS